MLAEIDARAPSLAKLYLLSSKARRSSLVIPLTHQTLLAELAHPLLANFIRRARRFAGRSSDLRA